MDSRLTPCATLTGGRRCLAFLHGARAGQQVGVRVDADGGEGAFRLDGAAAGAAQRDLRAGRFGPVVHERPGRTEAGHRSRQVPDPDVEELLARRLALNLERAGLPDSVPTGA